MRPQAIALWLSFGVPFVAYVFTASGFAYWLDSGEFVAAAVDLDIAHPPGHPLSGLWGKAFTLLPLGSLSFRVALGQAFASAAASALQCRATASALRGLRLDTALEWSLSLFAAWATAFTYAIWFQAVRPEVYALQSLCVAAMCERLLAIAIEPGAEHSRPLVSAAFVLGLALCNHHLIALMIVPAFLPALWRALRRRHLRSVAAAFVLGSVGLMTYVYLPLRAARLPPANLGDPRDLERFFWVVSARVYAHDMGDEAPQPLSTRALDVLELWWHDLHWPIVLLAIVGVYLCLRVRSTRKAAVVLATVWVVNASVRVWLGPVRANPDILGYLAPSFFAVGTFAACCLGAVCWLVQQKHPKARSWLARGAWLAPLAASALVPSAHARSTLAEFTATDDLDELRVRQLPARALVLQSSPQTVFRSFELDAVEAVRPDVLQVPLPFLRYPGMAEAWSAKHPELAGMFDDYLAAHDHLQAPSLLRAAETSARPILLELDTRVSPELYPYLRPRGLFTQFVARPERVERGQLERELAGTFKWLGSRLGAQERETETARQLLWVHYMNAVQLGALGLRAAGLSELARAQALHPSEARLPRLEQALRADQPFDPAVFLRF